MSCAPFQCFDEGVDEALSFFVDLLEIGDKPAVYARRRGLNMLEERCAEVPVASVRPERPPEGTAPLPEKLAGVRITCLRLICREFFAEGAYADSINNVMIRMSVYTADLLTVGAYYRGMPLDEEAGCLDS